MITDMWLGTMGSQPVAIPTRSDCGGEPCSPPRSIGETVQSTLISAAQGGALNPLRKVGHTVPHSNNRVLHIFFVDSVQVQ